MKPLIIYYLHTGNNERLGIELKDRIGCRIIKLNEKEKKTTATRCMETVVLLESIFFYIKL